MGKVSVLQRLIVPPRRLLDLPEHSEVHYVNIHNLALQDALQVGSIGDLIRPAPRHLAVENDVTPGSADSLIGLSVLGLANILDWKHCQLEWTALVGKDYFTWKMFWPVLQAKREEIDPDIDHIAWGLDKSDSLPEEIPVENLQKFGPAVKVPLVEFQLGLFRGSLGTNPNRHPGLLRNARKKIKSLIDAHIIRPRHRPYYSVG